MHRSLALALTLTVAAAGAAAAQDPRLERLDPATRGVVTAVIDSARVARLPAEPLVDRALEGVTKGAPGDRIIAAVRRLAGELGRARELLGADASAAEIEAGAAAVRAGAASDVFVTLRRNRPRQSLTVPLAVLADLVARGVPPDTAAAAVLAMAGADDDALIEFRRSVEHDIALGVLPATAPGVRLGNVTEAADGPRSGGAPPPAPRRP